MTVERWPALPYELWKDTYATLHLWSQVIGKIAVALAPPLNHGWGIAMQVTERGLRTGLLRHGQRTFTIAFDFIDHHLVVRTAEGEQQVIVLEPQTVADFYVKVMATLEAMSLPVKLWPVAVELPDPPIRLDRDTEHRTYDREFANRFWRILVQAERVFTEARCAFVGKSSPTHFFWGAFDLAVTRFSGRPAPPREGPRFMREAYSHEVISHGFWPGSGPLLEPSFYAYAAPEPSGLKEARIEPAAAYYHHELGEFILPYEAVRSASDPDRVLASFIETTYDRAATLANWDRAALDRPRVTS